MLADDERRLLFLYCRDHAVGHCCDESFKLDQLAADIIPVRREGLCPRCRRHLVEQIRDHLARCPGSPANGRAKSPEIRDAAATTAKQSNELRTRADILSREAEVARNRAERIVGPVASAEQIWLISRYLYSEFPWCEM